MKQPVDFHPEKPRLDLVETAPKPSIRLSGASIFEAPSIDLGELFPSPLEDEMKTLSPKEAAKYEFPRTPWSDRKNLGTDSLFQAGDLLEHLDRIVEEAESDHFRDGFGDDFQIPDIPPLPEWENRHDDTPQETVMTPHLDFRSAADSLENFLYENTPPTAGPTPPIAVPVKPLPSAPFRRPVRVTRSLKSAAPRIRIVAAEPFISPPAAPETSSPLPFEPGSGELLLARELTKSYYKKKLKIPVLKGVNFYVQPGEFVSIVGQSGSGKSTLLHLLGTLDNPESGSIHFEGRRIDNLSTSKRDLLRNRSIGFIFQFYHLLPELSTLENVLSPLMIRENFWGYLFKRKRYVEKAKAILHQVGLSHRLKHKPCELSGGEMQRAAIARALISEPKILLADEPTGNLDSASAREIIELLRKLKDEQNLTIVMVTHDNLFARTADRVVRMIDGVIVSYDDN